MKDLIVAKLFKIYPEDIDNWYGDSVGDWNYVLVSRQSFEKTSLKNLLNVHGVYLRQGDLVQREESIYLGKTIRGLQRWKDPDCKRSIVPQNMPISKKVRSLANGTPKTKGGSALSRTDQKFEWDLGIFITHSIFPLTENDLEYLEYVLVHTFLMSGRLYENKVIAMPAHNVLKWQLALDFIKNIFLSPQSPIEYYFEFNTQTDINAVTMVRDQIRKIIEHIYIVQTPS